MSFRWSSSRFRSSRTCQRDVAYAIALGLGHDPFGPGVQLLQPLRQRVGSLRVALGCRDEDCGWQVRRGVALRDERDNPVLPAIARVGVPRTISSSMALRSSQAQTVQVIVTSPPSVAGVGAARSREEEQCVREAMLLREANRRDSTPIPQ